MKDMIITLLMLTSITASAQTGQGTKKKVRVTDGDTVIVEKIDEHKTKVTDTKTGKSEIYLYVERMPEAPYNIIEYLSKEIKYPAKARKEKIEGRVNIKFVVNTTGEIENVQVTKSVHPLLDAEAIRVVELMPKWIPGKQNGKPVKVYYTLPISFKL